MKKFTLGLLFVALIAFAVGSPALAQSKTSDRTLLTRIARQLTKLQRTVTPPEKFKLSSGPFGIPDGAKAVDWVVLNESATSQDIKVTVYMLNSGGTNSTVPPGPLSKTLGAKESTHNAGGVGDVFKPGRYYQVVVEASSRSVLPMVTIWESTVNKPIAGTTIPAGSWKELQ